MNMNPVGVILLRAKIARQYPSKNLFGIDSRAESLAEINDQIAEIDRKVEAMKIKEKGYSHHE